MAEETSCPAAGDWSTLGVAIAGRGKRDTAEPLVLSGLSPDKSMVPGRARKSLVTPPAGWRSRLEECPLSRYDLGRLPAMACAVPEEPPCPDAVVHSSLLHRPS